MKGPFKSIDEKRIDSTVGIDELTVHQYPLKSRRYSNAGLPPHTPLVQLPSLSSHPSPSFSIADPENPVETDTFRRDGRSHGISGDDRSLYLADGIGGLWILDVSNLLEHFPGGSYNTPAFAIDVSIDGEPAFIAAEESGLWFVSVSDPAKPGLVSYLDTHDFATDVAIGGSFADIADSWGGIRIVCPTDTGETMEINDYRMRVLKKYYKWAWPGPADGSSV